MKGLVAIAIMWMLCGRALPAPPDASVVPISAREILRDFETLKNAPYFPFNPREGTTPMAAAFRRILKYSAGASQCRKLVSEATVPGQLFGMLGLKLLNDPAYALIAPRYKASRTAVSVAQDSRPYPMLVEPVAKMIDSGEIN